MVRRPGFGRVVAARVGRARREAHCPADRQQGYGASVDLLKNPHNDIALVGQALTAQEFG
jgi:hypothetical protein